MAKAFVFSLDAMFAIVILVLFMVTFSYLSSQIEDDPYPALVLEKQANDALIVLDKTGELSVLNSTLLNSSLTSMFPSSITWNLEINYYNYSEGFVLTGNFTTGSNYAEQRFLIMGQREFLIFENNAVKYYGLARLRLWTE